MPEQAQKGFLMLQLINAALAVVCVIAGLVGLFAVLGAVSGRLPERMRRRVQPLLFAGPALLLVGVVLVYPTIETVRISLYDDTSTRFVGLRNYTDLVTSPDVHRAVINNAAWLVIVPLVTVAVGLVVALLADRLSKRWEVTAKTLVFLPMAISFVGASTIFGFIYQFRAAGSAQTGLLNAAWTALGFQPRAWLTEHPWNNFFLMAIAVWMQSGLATVLLSGAIKNIPAETVEAARTDGANEWQLFWRIILPQIRVTIAMVLSTLTIFVLKIFDIVYVMTNGNFGSEVIADLFIKQIFTYNQYGPAAAIVVVLVLLTTPLIVWNIRRFRTEEATR